MFIARTEVEAEGLLMLLDCFYRRGKSSDSVPLTLQKNRNVLTGSIYASVRQ